ncbi:MAG: TRIC cation channel family protein [Trueperaceae bacterium]
MGLALFATLGAQQGITFRLGFWSVVFLGTVSGVGGGVLKDMLSRQIPVIFYRSGDFYASVAAVGSGVVFLLSPIEPTLALLVGVTTTMMMRVGSRWLGLSLPVPRD